MFASHRDACILSKYSADLVARLDCWYAANGLDDTVIAYRSLGGRIITSRSVLRTSSARIRP